MTPVTKRDFLKGAAATAGAAALAPFARIEQAFAATAGLSPVTIAARNDLWDDLRAQYGVTHDFIQLENGFYSLQSAPVLEAYIGHIRRINAVSSYYMRTTKDDDKAAVKNELARLLGAPPTSVIITRNTTEGLDTVIGGREWKPGDEAVMAEQDYGAMLDMFKLVARKHGVVNKVISLPMDPKSDDEVVAAYERAITPRTKLLMVCHMVNITGHILPVQKITAMAHRHGVEVMVDGAHAFAQLDFKLDDLGPVDYYASSLHKWLGTPLGAGLLYVRPDRVAALWPMFADLGFKDDDIRKLNHTGTHPVATDLAIMDAIKFHESIGIQRKEARLRYLQRYWTDQVRGQKRIVLNTPSQPQRSGAIANVGVEGVKPGELARRLMSEFRIFTVAIDGAGVHGVRVCPQVFTTTAELDQFVRALRMIAA
ncbi:MAG: aminotransferase class V-fold PLP-dependent enzyme [Gemmatimonadetes bacterium]|nr:aminotransferase class V-fold PLP-dependent enzyme [Gemmatimonadota bacterium]